MGLLIDGEWHDQWYDTDAHGGEFKRETSTFRHWLTADGSQGPEGQEGYEAAPDRYRLYVSYACPWAHRTLIVRALKGLEALLPISVVHWHMGDRGWSFAPGDGVIPDPEMDARLLSELYVRANAEFTGRVTVPVLWDTENDTIVNNESSELIRMFNDAFDGLGAEEGNFYPEALREEIDSCNERIYETLNNGVYKAGFATTQDAYQQAVIPLFETLTWLERRLSEREYLVGEQLTEADIRLFTTLVRFDPVYHGHFKCNLRRLSDHPNLWAYTRRLFQLPGVAETVNLDHIKRHYYTSHPKVNPTGIVPVGPEVDYNEPVTD